MFRITVQVRELISSNVTSALDAASNPAKMLNRLQREIEDAIIDLHGELSKARRQKERLRTELTQTEDRVTAWSEKAKVAMNHGREDLARQALMAREDCRGKQERIDRDIDGLAADITEMESAIGDLESKRDEVRQRHADLVAADAEANSTGAGRQYGSRTERRLDHIDALEKRTAFAVEAGADSCSNAAIEREIEEMRRGQAIEEELAAMRQDKPSGAKKPAAKSAKHTKAA